MCLSTTTGGGLRAPLRREAARARWRRRRSARTVYYQEQAALREALERGTATTHVDRTVPPKVTVSAASVDVRVNAPKNTVPWKQP